MGVKVFRRDVKGFTLVEIVIVSVILAVIAGLAMPVYGTMIETSRSNEAKTTLSIILMAEKIYKLNSSGSVYWGPGATSPAAINSALNVDLMPQFYNSDWNVTAAGAGSTATFTAQVGRGNPYVKWFRIDQAGTITEGGSYG